MASTCKRRTCMLASNRCRNLPLLKSITETDRSEHEMARRSPALLTATAFGTTPLLTQSIKFVANMLLNDTAAAGNTCVSASQYLMNPLVSHEMTCRPAAA